MKQVSIVAWLLFTLSPAFTAADHICLGSGPQTPRDISQKFGTIPAALISHRAIAI